MYFWAAFNRTILELKLRIWFHRRDDIFSFNRTILELKQEQKDLLRQTTASF